MILGWGEAEENKLARWGLSGGLDAPSFSCYQEGAQELVLCFLICYFSHEYTHSLCE